MTDANKRWLIKLDKLFRLMGSPSTGERDAARRHLDDHLASAKKSWNDLPELLKAAESEVAAEAERKRQRQAGADDPDGPAAPNAGDDVGGEVDELNS